MSLIKERILQLAESKGVRKTKFPEKIGMTYSSFKGDALKTPINSEAIGNILSLYPDVDLQWLITGKECVQAENYSKVAEPGLNYQSNHFEDLTIDKKLNAIYKELKNIKENTKTNKEEIAKVELDNFTKHLEYQQKFKELKIGGQSTIKREA